MLSHFCLLAFVVSNAAAATTPAQLCEIQPECGDYKLAEGGNSSGSSFYEAVRNYCEGANITVSEDKKMVSLDFGPNYSPTEYEVQEDGCAKRVTADQQGIVRESFLKVAGACDEVFLNVVCLADTKYVFLVSNGASTECVKKALEVLRCKYGQPTTRDPAEATCVRS